MKMKTAWLCDLLFADFLLRARVDNADGLGEVAIVGLILQVKGL